MVSWFWLFFLALFGQFCVQSFHADSDDHAQFTGEGIDYVGGRVNGDADNANLRLPVGYSGAADDPLGVLMENLIDFGSFGEIFDDDADQRDAIFHFFSPVFIVSVIKVICF